MPYFVLMRCRSRVTRDKDRDVSERIALGMAKPTVPGRGRVGVGDQVQGAQDMQYDQRLFNQSEGIDSGFGAEDSYHVYDKSLFKGSSMSHLYKPKQSDQDAFGEDNVDDVLKKARFRVSCRPRGQSTSADGGAGGQRFQRDRGCQPEPGGARAV